jgi:hypothetical protein
MPTYHRIVRRHGVSALRVALCGLVLLACGEEPTDVASEHFPPLDPSVMAELCIRGAALGTATIEGELATTDCARGMGRGYWDAIRFRVPIDATVTFEVDSQLDSELELFRIDDLSDYWASRVRLGYDDDSGAGYDARLSLDLVREVEYLLIVSGSDDFQRGPYTLRITGSQAADGDAA